MNVRDVRERERSVKIKLNVSNVMEQVEYHMTIPGAINGTTNQKDAHVSLKREAKLCRFQFTSIIKPFMGKAINTPHQKRGYGEVNKCGI